MYYLARFTCGYCGTDETIGFKSDTREQVEDYCTDYLPDYAQSWEHLADWDDEDDPDEAEAAFLEDCDYRITEYENMEDIDGYYDSFEDFTK